MAIASNFNLIKQYISFPDDDHFYFIQIIQRKKEHASLSKSNKVIRTYYINSHDHLLNKIRDIETLCDQKDARAYINLNRRSYRKCAMMMLKNTTDHIISEDYKGVARGYDSVCGQYPDDPDKTWVVDVDHLDCSLSNIEDAINQCMPINGNKVKMRVPTKNGIHIISRPFNLQEFREYGFDVDVHKNNPTLLCWKK